MEAIGRPKPIARSVRMPLRFAFGVDWPRAEAMRYIRSVIHNEAAGIPMVAASIIWTMISKNFYSISFNLLWMRIDTRPVIYQVRFQPTQWN